MSYVLITVTQTVPDEQLHPHDLDEEYAGVFATDMYGSRDPVEDGIDRYFEIMSIRCPQHFDVKADCMDMIGIPRDARWI